MIPILHSTQLPENLGAVARVMGNFDLFELRLVTPQVDPLHPKAIATAAGAERILRYADIYPSILDATSDLHLLFGTCADERAGIRHYFSPKRAFEGHEGRRIGVLFGCERTGLTQDDLSLCQATIQIPVNPFFSSMNLSHAVAVIAYEWFTVNRNPPLSKTHLGATQMATQKQRQFMFEALMQKLDAVDYWRVPFKKKLMAQNLANLFFRMDFTEQEIHTLLGVFRALSKS